MSKQLKKGVGFTANSFNKNTKVKYWDKGFEATDVCIFSSYNFSEKVEEYVFYYLDTLEKAGFSIVFVSTSPLRNDCISRLSKCCFLIIERENVCPDFGSWKTALSVLDWGKKLNSVLLVNDSVFGPLYDLDAIISIMKNKYDIWGMTDSYEVAYHIQSYFLYFNKAVINSDLFTKFWKKVDLAASKSEVIFKYEIGLSSLFSNSKFSLGAYVPTDILVKSAVHSHKIINPTLVFWKVLIEKHSFPFFKRELLIKKDISKTYCNVDLYINVGRWKKIITNNTIYPIVYIDEFMLHYYDAIKKINCNNIILRNRKLLFVTHTVEISGAVQVLINFLQWLKNETDINVEIIVCKESDSKTLTEFAEFGIVTNFYELTESGRRSLKERLIDEIAVIFSNNLENIGVQKFLSFLDVPQVIYVHELTDSLNQFFSVHNNRTWARNNITQFIASAEIVKQNLIECLAIADEKVVLVNKFVNTYNVEYFEKRQHETRSDLGIAQDVFVVGMCGAFEWKNSPDLLPALAAKLCCGDKDIHIVWLGADSSSPLYDRIKFDLNRLGIANKVHLLGGGMDRRAFFSVIDVFVMAAREDAFPLVNLESGFAGKPVICFQDAAGSNEYVNLGTGKAVPYLDVNALSEEVSKYYENRSRLLTEKKQIQQIVNQKFTTAVKAPKLLQLIRNFYDEDELTFQEDLSATFMVHIYYENSWEEIRNKLKDFNNGKNYFLFSISEACLTKKEIIEDINKSFKNVFFLVTSTIGNEIGGKMALIDLYLLMEIKTSYIVFLHDRKSLQTTTRESWKNGLFKVIDPNNQKLILTLFKDPKIGIVGAKDYIVNEYDNDNETFLNNNQLSKKILTEFDLTIHNYDFLAGSSYWLRSSIIKKFFGKYHPILIRANLEANHVLDSNQERLSHTWERIFSWAATNEGYTIKGI